MRRTFILVAGVLISALLSSTAISSPVMISAPPLTLNCQNISVTLPSTGGSVSITPADVLLSVSDPGAVASSSLNISTFSCANVGANTVVLTMVDTSGASFSCSSTVTVVDATAPTFTVCSSNITVEADENSCSNIVNFPMPSATDNCQGVTVAQTDNTGLSSGSAFPVGTTTIIYTATDASGNTATCTFDVIVEDTQAPDMNCLTNIVVNADPGACSAVVNYTAPTATDNCGPATVSQLSGLSSGSAFPIGITLMEFVATDIYGNEDTCTFQVVVSDNQTPSITCPANISVSNDPASCGANVMYNVPTATDNCSNLTVTRTAGPASGGFFPIGNTTVTYVAYDGSGNSDTCSFTVTVTDDEDPTLSCPGNITVDTDVNACGAIVNFNVIPSDNCSGFVIGQTDNTGLSSGSFFPVGTTTLAYEVTDASGNTASCTFDVTVEDNDPPTLTCPTNFTVNLTTECDYTLEDFTQIAIGADNCGGTQFVTLTQTPAPGIVMVDGDSETVTITATDQVGNSSTCTFTVSVRDAQPPVVACNDLMMDSVKADTECMFEVGDYSQGVSVSDNCTDVSQFSISQSPASGTMVDGGSGMVTVTVTVTGPDGFRSDCNTTLIVTCAVPLSIPESFSPNNDGINDTWEMPGIEEYPNNSLKVFNRYGDLLYSAMGYLGGWDGTAQEGGVVYGEGSVLPEGTYYYVLDLGNGEDPLNGYVYLRK
jgi:gliding motility-associated-like protein